MTTEVWHNQHNITSLPCLDTLPCSEKFNATGESPSSYLQPLSSHDTAIFNQSGDFYSDIWFKRYQTLLWEKLFQNITKDDVVVSSFIFFLRMGASFYSTSTRLFRRLRNRYFVTSDPKYICNKTATVINFKINVNNLN